DSLLQFGSPAGRAAYLTSMGAVASGGAGQLASGLGTFGDRRGDFHAPEAARQRGAAIGNVGIDVTQLLTGGFAGRIGRASLAAERQAVGLSDDAARNIERVGGRVFTKNADGTVASVRTSAQIVVPSELVTWAAVRGKANIRAKRAQ